MEIRIADADGGGHVVNIHMRQKQLTTIANAEAVSTSSVTEEEALAVGTE